MDLISGRYQLYEFLGQGGMGTVYRVIDRLTGNDVALKMLTMSQQLLSVKSAFESSIEKDLQLALAHEFQILASLRHPNIISVLDYGFEEMGRPYFTMTYLANAQTIVQAAKHKSTEERVDLLQQTLQALAYLHRRRILHRDVKPENVLVDGDSVRVLDFGLATGQEQDASSGGTLAYLAPEVLDGYVATEKSDLYAVGVIAYEIFAGQYPFDPTSLQVIDQILYEMPDIAQLDVQPELAQIIGRLLQKKPEARFESVEACMAALNRAIGRHVTRENEAIRESYLQAAEFVGREQEMAQLQRALNAAKEGHGSAWLVGGESGVGKTRLLNEIRIQALVEGATVLRGQSVADVSDLTYQLWRDVIRRLILTSQLDSLAISVLQTIVPDIGVLLEQPVISPPPLEGQAGKQRLMSTITNLFEQQERWMLLILEDLQWVGESLDILLQLNRIVSHVPLLIIGSYQNDERPTLPEELLGMEHLLLPRLTQSDVQKLSLSMLGDVSEQPEVMELLQREAEGNAFFLVEVVRTLAELAGGLSAIDQVKLPERLFPQGIQTIIQRRLNRLPELIRGLLPGAAIAGRQIDPLILDDLIAQLNFPLNLETWLIDCADAAVIDISDGAWQFTHDKLRAHILDELSESERKIWHKRVASAIETVYPDEPMQAATLTYHWQQIGDKNRERYYARIAGERARQQFSNADAIHYLSRALMLTSPDALIEQYELLLAREQVYHLQGEREAQQQDLEALAELAGRLVIETKEDYRAQVALRLAKYAEATSDYVTATAAATEALNIAQMTNSREDEAASYLTWGHALLRRGEYDEAEEKLQLSLTQAGTSQLKQVEADSLRFLGVRAADLGQFDEAKAYYMQALPLYQLLKDRQGESTILNNLSVVAYSRSELEEALNYWEEARKIHLDIGDREGHSRVLSNLSTVYTDLGDYETGRAYSEKALSICREIDLRFGQCFNLINLSLISYYLRDEKSAEEHGEAAYQLAQDMGSSPLLGMTLKDRGFLLTHLGKLDEAEEAYRQALKIWEALSQQQFVLEAQSGLAQVSLLKGDFEQAQNYCQPVVAHLRAGNSLEGMTRPFAVYLVCYEILQLSRDPYAPILLELAHNELEDYAKRITDERRQRSFLENVPTHRELHTLFRLQANLGSTST